MDWKMSAMAMATTMTIATIPDLNLQMPKITFKTSLKDSNNL